MSNTIYITNLEVDPVPYAFLQGTVKFLWGSGSISEGFQLQNAPTMFLFFHEKCLLSNSKNYSWC